MGRLLTFVFAFLFSVLALAQAAPDLPVNDFLSLVFDAVKKAGGLSWGLKVGLIINVVIASMKVSLVRQFTWDKLPGAIKPWVGPLLAFVAGFIALGKWDWPSLFAWMLAGGGAVLLDNVLEGVKLIPGLGPQYVALIAFFEKLLKKPQA